MMIHINEGMNLHTFKKLLNDKFIIFGSGFVAQMFYSALLNNNLHENIAFVVETNPEKGRTFHGISVLPYSKTETKGIPVLACVHDSVIGEIGVKPEDNVIQVYPFIWNLLFEGEDKTEMISLSTLMKRQNTEEGWIAARYAGVRGICEGREDFKNLYVKLLSLHCSVHTAKRRLGYLEMLIQTIRNEGFREEFPVLLDKKLRIIDGLHRIAIAVYFGTDRISVRYLDTKGRFETALGEKNRLTKEFLLKNGLYEEAKVLDELKAEMEKKWNKDSSV